MCARGATEDGEGIRPDYGLLQRCVGCSLQDSGF